MPELPEVECVRRSLERLVLGRRVRSVRVNRRDVIRGPASPAALLQGGVITRLQRHGKQLAIVGESGACITVHLGMSGRLGVLPTPSKRSDAGAGSQDARLPPHTHVIWQLDDGQLVRFTDPRRFGGLWTFANLDTLRAQRWAKLGPDALAITPATLHRKCGTTRRGLKAALLDQGLVAGLGNIYVDELLFAMRLHPLRPADELDRPQCESLVRRMRTLLLSAIEHGGSTLRDYVDADNKPGTQQSRHRVYGRGGSKCLRRGCRSRIATQQIAGRTTAWCPSCQPLPAPGG